MEVAIIIVKVKCPFTMSENVKSVHFGLHSQSENPIDCPNTVEKLPKVPFSVPTQYSRKSLIFKPNVPSCNLIFESL